MITLIYRYTPINGAYGAAQHQKYRRTICTKEQKNNYVKTKINTVDKIIVLCMQIINKQREATLLDRQGHKI